MWNSVLLDGTGKWPSVDEGEDSPFIRSWNFQSHQQTNYADWTSSSNGPADDAEELFLRHHESVDGFPSAAELFRNFVGDEGADRMEFYVNHLTMESSADVTSNDQNYRPPFPLLETIAEETPEDLLQDMSDCSSSPSSSSGRWGWGWGWLNTSDDDSSSVIHVPETATEKTDLDDEEEQGSERDHEIPKKKRKMEEDEESSRSPSVTESLIQFEALEKELEEPIVFRTSATSAPFEDNEEEPDVFLDCHELVEASSVHFNDNDFEATMRRTWSSCDTLKPSKRNAARRCKSACDFPGQLIAQGEIAAWPTFGPSHDEQDCWEADEYSDPETDYDSDYSAERGDRFDEFALGFLPGRSPRMRSFRSYGDSLNSLLLDDSAQTSSCSSGSPDRSSPEEERQQTRPTRRSVEALSEDSGYGDASGCVCAPSETALELPTCPPHVELLPEVSALLLRRQPRSRPTPLSLKDAQEFGQLREGPARCAAVENLESKMSYHTSDGNAGGVGNSPILRHATTATDLERETSKFNPEIGEEEIPEGEAAAAGSGYSSLPDASEAHNCSGVGHNVTCSPSRCRIMDSAFYPAPVVLKRYGARQEVEVYISHQQLPISPVVAVPAGINAVRGVHFSPVVSSVNWRESYLDQSEDDDQMEPEEDVLPAPSVVQVAHPVVTEKPLDVVVAAAVQVEKEEEEEEEDSGRNSGNISGGSSKKAPLFQRFSLARLSARMSATFTRSDSKRESAKNKKANDAKTTVVKEPKKGRFFRSFQQRSSSTRPLLSAGSTDRVQVDQEPVAQQPSTPPATTTPEHPATVVKELNAPIEVVESAAVPVAPARSSHSKPPLPPRNGPARKTFVHDPPAAPMVSSAGLQHALQHFKETARVERQRLANSVPDLLAAPVNSARPTSCIDPMATPAPSKPPVAPLSRERARLAVLSRASSVENAWNATASRAALNLSRRHVAAAASEGHQAGPALAASNRCSRPVVPGLLETNLDAVVVQQPRQHETNLDELIQNLQLFCSKRGEYSSSAGQQQNEASHNGGGAVPGTSSDKRFKSMLNLGSNSAPVSVQPDIDMMIADSNRVMMPDPNRAKSMEFLLDDDNKSAVHVPENQLKKCGERQMSEHELRIQRSLQKLNVPEWYKNNARSNSVTSTTTGVLSRRRDYHGGSASLRNNGWTGLSVASNRDQTTASSMTSLGSVLSRAATPTRVVIPTRVRPDWRNVKSSRESLASPSAVAESPSFARWGSGRSSYSTCPSPAPSAASSASTYRSSMLNQHGRQPYLGWRSQERLNNSTPAPLSVYQSPAERLASSLLAKKEPEAEAKPQEEDEGVRSSIRQVTSAIVHYVTENSDEAGQNGSSSPERHPLEALSRSPSPRRQRCVWLESSFVGDATKPQPRAPSPAAPTNNGRPGELMLA